MRWLQTMQLWIAAQDGCAPPGGAELYRHARVAGVVTGIRLDPCDGVIITTIGDGTSQVVAEWALERCPDQLRAAPGMGLILDGVPRAGRDGEAVFVEPAYEIVPGPGAARE